MHAVPVDERNSCWEEHRPRFRAYLFHRENPQSSWAVETYDIVDADAIEAIACTEDQAGIDRLFALALVSESGAEPDPVKAHRGLTWLVGMDARSRIAAGTVSLRYGRLMTGASDPARPATSAGWS